MLNYKLGHECDANFEFVENTSHIISVYLFNLFYFTNVLTLFILLLFSKKKWRLKKKEIKCSNFRDKQKIDSKLVQNRQFNYKIKYICTHCPWHSNLAMEEIYYLSEGDKNKKPLNSFYITWESILNYSDRMDAINCYFKSSKLRSIVLFRLMQ